MQGKFDTAQRVEEEELIQGRFDTAQCAEDEELLQGKFETAQRVEEEEPLQGKFETVQRVEEEELVQSKFETAQRAEDDEPLQGKFTTVQRAEDEDLFQGKFDTTQRMSEEEPMQAKFADALPTQLAEQANAKPNNTGLPNQLKAGIESLSGMSMDHVKVHYNSAQPAQLNAHAYAQGSEIHVAPGQEQHLPHEAWHVVQQAQGRVKPTMQMKMGVPVNDDVGLETEADVMGAKALGQGERQMSQKEPADALRASLPTQLIGAGSANPRNILPPTPYSLIQNKEKLGTQFIKSRPLQRVKVNGKSMSFKDLASVIESMDISKGVKQKFLVRMQADTNNFTDQEKANAYILSEAQKLGAPVDHEQIKQKGDDTEAAAASIIGGQVNRSTISGRDVEWRFINRGEAEAIKKQRGMGGGSDTDQTLFEDWKAVLANVDPRLIGRDDLRTILSTPPDAFSSSTLALAGGAMKFQDGGLNLTATAADRVKELVKLGGMLGYQVVLVFSSAVTCEQCDAVANKYGVTVIHLEA
jgi:hypothetical protein